MKESILVVANFSLRLRAPVRQDCESRRSHRDFGAEVIGYRLLNNMCNQVFGEIFSIR